jgi:hypothetical protein
MSWHGMAWHGDARYARAAAHTGSLLRHSRTSLVVVWFTYLGFGDATCLL